MFTVEVSIEVSALLVHLFRSHQGDVEKMLHIADPGLGVPCSSRPERAQSCQLLPNALS